MTKHPHGIKRKVLLKLSRKLISMLLIAMFLVTSITATDVITPALTPQSELQPLTNHCYFEVDNVSGYWVERWYSNVLDVAYFVPDDEGDEKISGANLISPWADIGNHPHEGSLSNVTNIAPGSSYTEFDELPSYINTSSENSILVIDNSLSDVSSALTPLDTVPHYYYRVYWGSTASYYGDLICIFG